MARTFRKRGGTRKRSGGLQQFLNEMSDSVSNFFGRARRKSADAIESGSRVASRTLHKGTSAVSNAVRGAEHETSALASKISSDTRKIMGGKKHRSKKNRSKKPRSKKNRSKKPRSKKLKLKKH